MKLELNNKVMINIKNFYNIAKIDEDNVIVNQYRVDLLESDNTLPKDIAKIMKEHFTGTIKIYQDENDTEAKEINNLKLNSVSYSITDEGKFYNIFFVDAE